MENKTLQSQVEEKESKNQTYKEHLVDDIVHELEALDFNSKEAREVVRNVLTAAEQRGAEKERERLEKELEIADDRWKRAEQHHREEHESGS